MSEYNFVNFGEGFGITSSQDVEQLNKALEAGYGYAGAPTALTGGGVLQVESLDRSLKSVTFEMKNIKFWPIIAKDQAFNTVEQYNRIDAFGDQGRGFIAEAALPRSEDASYSRQIQRIRFIGVTKELAHVHTLVRNAHGDAIASQIRNGTMRILEIVERSLFEGRGFYSNAGLFDGAAAILDADLAWEGLDIQIRKGNADATAKAKAFTGYGLEEDVIKDLRGAVIDEDELEDAARIAAENFGMPNLLMLDTKAHSDLGRQFYPKERVVPMGIANGKAGFVLQQFMASAGAIDLVSDVFLRPKRTASPVADAPAVPSLGAVTPVAAADAASKFEAAEAGDYYYKAAAINANGESLMGASSLLVAVVAGDKVTFTVPATAGAIAYAIYRSIKDADAQHEFIGYVAPAAVGGTAAFTDLNHKLPGLSQAYLLTNDAECMRFKQLAPLMKMDLALIATAYRWMQLLYGALIVFAPRKNVILENIGKAS